MPRIVVLGNSISAQRSGYVPVVEQVLACGASGTEIVNLSLGGVGTLGLLALFDLLVRVPQADEVVIESSASDAAGATSPEDVEWAFDQLLQRAFELQPQRITVLHLGRMDVSPERHEFIVRAQQSISRIHGACSVDLRTLLEKDGFKDGVHLSSGGAAVIGRQVAHHLEQASNRPRKHVGSSVSSLFVPVTDERWNWGIADRAYFRSALPTVRLHPGQNAQVDLGHLSPIALVVIVGPSSGVVRIAGSGQSSTAQWRDRWCDVRRIQVAHVPARLRHCAMLEIEATDGASAETDAWGMPSGEMSPPAIAELAGILVRQSSQAIQVTHDEF